MHLKTFTGVEKMDSILCQKPISHLYIREILPLGGLSTGDYKSNSIRARVRIVDSKTGRSKEVLPSFDLAFVSDLSVAYEGFNVVPALIEFGGQEKYEGEATYNIILGQTLPDGRTSCVDLSNEKHFDLELTGLNPNCNYEVYGMEGHLISDFVRTYSAFYMPTDEEQRTYATGENEVLMLPTYGIREVQFYAKNGASFNILHEELVQDARNTNDIATVGMRQLSHEIGITPKNGVDMYLGFRYSFILSIDEFNRMDIRRNPANVGDKFSFLMVDTKPTVEALTQ